MLKEFKEFALRGNMIDMAVGIIVGGAFGKVVASLVADVIMPPIGLLAGNVDFSGLFVSLSGETYDSLAAAKAAGAPTLSYGLFLNSVLDFLVVGLAVFVLVKQMNRLRREPPGAAPTERDCPFCLAKIPVRATRCGHCTSQVAVA